MDLSSNAAGRSLSASNGITRKSLLAIGLGSAGSFVVDPTAVAATNRDTATAKRLTKLRKAREKVVIEHGRAEDGGDPDRTLDTFSRAREEIIPLGDVHKGDDEVKSYYDSTFGVFPDLRNGDATLRHADCAVITEVILSGTMKGPLGPIPATNKSFRLRISAFFLFAPNTAKLMGERVYYDLFSLLQQIGVLEAVVGAGVQFPAGGGVPLNKREPGVKARAT